MSKKVRFNLTNDEKLAQQLVGLEKEGIRMNKNSEKEVEIHGEERAQIH